MLAILLGTAFAQRTLFANLTNANAAYVQTNFMGNVTIYPHANSMTKVVVQIQGLAAGSPYGLHVHQACDPTSCAAYNFHWDVNPGPNNLNHGKWNSIKKHVGDLMMCETDLTGRCQYSFYTDLNLLGGVAPITTSQGVVLHAQADDNGLGGQTSSPITGNSGGRIACGCFVNYGTAVQAVILAIIMMAY